MSKLGDLGLWFWQDVAEWSEAKGAWPEGAENIEEAPQNDYGPYLDVELTENPEEVGFLINNTQGENLSGEMLLRFQKIRASGPLLPHLFPKIRFLIMELI
ncbi:pullulanase-associated domain-containing protein [Halanaerobium saccharolyticum]|uniref:pullulanase-associated domain-containing protein n=1 Tax=Halanaerobium saccharolyticum TaxID=43595 RepID=UPI000D34CA8F